MLVFHIRVHENSFQVQASERAIYNSLHTRNGAWDFGGARDSMVFRGLSHMNRQGRPSFALAIEEGKKIEGTFGWVFITKLFWCFNCYWQVSWQYQQCIDPGAQQEQVLCQWEFWYHHQQMFQLHMVIHREAVPMRTYLHQMYSQ